MQLLLEDVTYAYPGQEAWAGGREALAGLSLQIARGEYVALLGRNGSGKSTLAKLLNGLLRPARGAVRSQGIDTRDPGRWPELRRQVGMVFEDPAHQLIGETVEADAAFGPENLGLAPAQVAGRVAAALRATALEALAERPTALLSGGEQQRAAWAGVLAMQPVCLVLDEATAQLDADRRRELLALLRRLQRQEGVTVLHVTHDMDEALLADRVVVLDAGRVVRDGAPHEVFADPDAISALGLELPPVAELCARLRRDGYALPAGVLSVEAALTALLALAQGEAG